MGRQMAQDAQRALQRAQQEKVRGDGRKKTAPFGFSCIYDTWYRVSRSPRWPSGNPRMLLSVLISIVLVLEVESCHFLQKKSINC